jgi:hypothetical protein
MSETAARRYARQPLDVAALQYTGANAAGMTAFLGAHFEMYGGDDAEVLTTKHWSWTPIEPGNWAVLGPGGSVSVMDDDDFTAMFAAVGDA